MISKPFLLLLPLLTLLLPFASSQIFVDTWMQEAPIPNVTDPRVQDLGSWAVSQYDEKGESHLYFIEVVNGTYFNWLAKGYRTVWLFRLKAKNCSHPGPPEMYEAQMDEGVYYHYGGDPPGHMISSFFKNLHYLKQLYT